VNTKINLLSINVYPNTHYMNTRTTKKNSIKWNLVVLVAAAVLLVGIGVPASSSSISILKVNAQVGNQTNATGYFSSGPKITGSIAMGPTIAKAIASQVHVSLANASEIAEKAVGSHTNSVAVRIGVVHGFLVYMALVVDSSNNFHGVLVDAGNGKVLASNAMPLQYLSALAAIMTSGTGMMTGPGIMGPGMSGYGAGMMQHGMMNGPGMMMGHP
jgi:uncharacterized membrane protein YkoI